MPQKGLEGRLAISRRYTSGAKSTWEADFHPDVTRQENREVPQRGLEGRLTISRRYTSGAKSTWEADFHPDVTRQENWKVPQRGLEGRLAISRRYTSGKPEAAKRGKEAAKDLQEVPQRGRNSVVPNRFGIDVPWRAV